MCESERRKRESGREGGRERERGREREGGKGKEKGRGREKEREKVVSMNNYIGINYTLPQSSSALCVPIVYHGVWVITCCRRSMRRRKRGYRKSWKRITKR